MAIETTFENNPSNGFESAIETTLPRNPSNVQLMEVVTNLQQLVGVLNSKVTTLEKKVHQLEDSNFKLGKKINKISSRKMSTKGSGSKAKIEPKKPKPEKNKNTARASSFGGGGMFFDYDDDDDSDDDDSPLEHGLGHDTFSLLKVKPVSSLSWLFTTVVYVIQVMLLGMIFLVQSSQGDGSTPFDIPFSVTWSVRLGQIIAVLVTITLSRDIFLPIKELSTLWFSYEHEWLKVTGPLKEKRAFPVWCVRILIPNILQLFVGGLALLVSFIIIIQSEDVITLFADFAAMSVIAELDNIAFWFAENGYIGDIIMNDAQLVQHVTITERIAKLQIGKCLSINLRTVLLLVLSMGMMAAYAPIAYLQVDGRFFAMKYPNCALKKDKIANMGDEKCDGGIQNTIECGFDHGDCFEFNIGYPGCPAPEPETVGDNECNTENDVPQCKFDGGDCCPIKTNARLVDYTNLLGDGNCHAGFFFTEKCIYDNGDCDSIREEYPNCKDLNRPVFDQQGNPVIIGNGICDQDKQDIKEYMTEECGWVFGDCVEVKRRADKRQAEFPECSFDDMFRVGDNVCDRGEYTYLNEACGWDKFDCCDLDHSKIGDGVCDSNDTIDYLTPECGYEGYDCCPENVVSRYVNNGECGDILFDFLTGYTTPKEELAYNKECAFEGSDCFIKDYPNCNVEVAKDIGNGFCNGGDYNVESCGWDGGDCIEINELYPECNADSLAYLGNGLCDREELNNELCGYDGGDCILFNSKYPDCKVGDDMYKIGNGYCDYSPYQAYGNKECGYDGGDCDENGNAIFNPLVQFNIDYPNCEAAQPNRVGDGNCRGDYNNAACGWDGGDCLELNLAKIRLGLGAECDPDFPQLLGNGECNGGGYNTEACKWDAGDCVEFNEKYPDCNTNFPRQVGNGICNTEENVEACGWDGGDCYMEEYPDCHAPVPLYIGDGECDDAPEFNNEECGWDGGDCLKS